MAVAVPVLITTLTRSAFLTRLVIPARSVISARSVLLTRLLIMAGLFIPGSATALVLFLLKIVKTGDAVISDSGHELRP